MPRPCSPRSLVLGSILALASPACDPSVPPRDSVRAWPSGEAVAAGACSVRLSSVRLYHSTEWHLEVEATAENTGSEKVKCSIAATAMTSTDDVLTQTAEVGGSLAPGETWERAAASREADMTGLSSGPAEGAWVHVEVAEGSWPMATTAAAHVTPERTRPPE